MTRYDEMRKAFLAYHKLNPWVWVDFERISLEFIQRGYTRYQPNAIINAIRVAKDREAAPTLLGHSQFHFSNNHSPFYARMFREMHPEHRSFFRIRFQFSKLKNR